MARCKSCEAEIKWVTTSGGKATPLDAKPDPKGRWVIAVGDVTHLATDDDRRLLRPTYTNHFATCPSAASWRGGGR